MVFTLRIDDPKTWDIGSELDSVIRSRPDLFDISVAGRHCDLVLRSTSTLLKSPGLSCDYYGAPVILFDSYDTTWLAPPIIEEAAKPEVKAYVRSNTFRDPVSYYRQTWQGSYSGHVLKSAIGSLPPNPLPLRTDDYLEATIKKIVLLAPVIPFMPPGVLDFVQEASLPIPSRSTDFLTNTLGVNKQQLSLLRCKGGSLADCTTDALFHEDGIGKYAGMEYLRYLAALCETKVFVSPWGRSAWSRADIEALLCGCMIVKPECSNTKTQPDIYSLHTGWLQYCSPDLSDLNIVAHYVLENYLEFAYAAEEGQSFLIDYYTTQATQSSVAEKLFSLCKHILAGTESTFKDITTKIPLGQ
jgi:hypothetical protein